MQFLPEVPKKRDLNSNFISIFSKLELICGVASTPLVGGAI